MQAKSNIFSILLAFQTLSSRQLNNRGFSLIILKKAKIPACNRRGFSLILLYLYMEIHPNAFATELIRIMTANTGHRYWTMIWNTLFLWNFPSP